MSQLRKDHSEIRFSAFQIIDSLFQRSHLFRELILEQFQGIFELVLETNPHHSLPAPRKTANELKKLSAKSIKEWHDKFGSNYKLLDLGFSFLKNCKKVLEFFFFFMRFIMRFIEKRLILCRFRINQMLNEFTVKELMKNRKYSRIKSTLNM